MERSDVLKIMAVLRGAYPQFYRDISRQEAEDTVALWLDMFRKDNPALVGAAVKSIIEGDETSFPPTIGQVKAKMRLITGRGELTEAEAWNMVSAAIRNGLYGAQEEFEKFPPILKRIVGSPNMLHEWARMDSDTVHSVVASNFQRSYRAVSAREREIAKLPPDVREIVQQIGTGRETDTLPDKKPAEELPPPKRIVPEWMRQENQKPAQKRNREEVIAALRDGAEVQST
ncbi:MAG: replicative helicase loader/inhibitor [Dysosmobacter sp.]|nr:replicative helicase loader/inhibitor [Dysosmobacter sp.]